MARTSRKQGSPLRGCLDAIRQEEGKAAGRLKPPDVEAGLYVRLSDQDNGGKSTDGIDNQLELLLEFVKQFEKVKTVETYMDNGQTGTDFERPGWKRMMEDAKCGRINCIIV